MSRFYFTFGLSYNLRNNYVVVEAENGQEARAAFRAARADLDDMDGRLYAFDYDEAAFAGQAEQYGYTEVPIDAPIWRVR